MHSQPLTCSNRQPIRYDILWTTDKKTNVKAPLSWKHYLDSLQKSVWLLWCGVTYTLAKCNFLPLKIQAWKVQVEEPCNSLPAEGSAARIPPAGASGPSENCQYLLCMTMAFRFSLSFWLKMERCWRNYSTCSTSTKILALEKLTVTGHYHRTCKVLPFWWLKQNESLSSHEEWKLNWL